MLRPYPGHRHVNIILRLVRLSLDRAVPMYQTRHTLATLMLAFGENPSWVAQQLGHTSAEMVYRRERATLGRGDGDSNGDSGAQGPTG